MMIIITLLILHTILIFQNDANKIMISELKLIFLKTGRQQFLDRRVRATIEIAGIHERKSIGDEKFGVFFDECGRRYCKRCGDLLWRSDSNGKNRWSSIWP